MTLAPWHAAIVELHAFFPGWLGGTPGGLAWVHGHKTWLPVAVQLRGQS